MTRTLNSIAPRALVGLTALGVGLAGCVQFPRHSGPNASPPADPTAYERQPDYDRPAITDRSARERGRLIVCGEAVPVEARVVTFLDEGGYDAYSTDLHFEPPLTGSTLPEDCTLRHQPGRVARSGSVLVEAAASDRAELRDVVDQFVLHYDQCGVSQTCFKVLHDRRCLSVHFLLDVDGTIYQTLDLRDQGWHATKANPRSIGVEIAHIGAYPPGDSNMLDQWYSSDEAGLRMVLPAWLGDGGIATADFVARPARPGRQRGVVQGQLLEMPDFTPEQYDSLIALTVALCREFPRIRAEAPRDLSGQVLNRALSADAFDSFSGILGHYHVQTNKVDPGPGFDWERYLADVRAHLRVEG